MTSELRLLGKTVATRHVIIRAPTAGRVIGMKLVSGDSVRKGQVVAHVINREIEAAEAGLAVASKIDPQDAPALRASVGRYNHTAGIPVVAPEAGIVSAPPVSSGQMVADLDTIVDLIDPASLYIDTSVPVSQLSLMRPGMTRDGDDAVSSGHRVSRAHRGDPAELRRDQRDLVGADRLHRRRSVSPKRARRLRCASRRPACPTRS